ncbi:hypothetical cytosolic protein [Syntrophus aciditrophicus SB]|uniref:Hypothetical cytosolic protein n=1 Tax=Syntrophus aciditrophicus (strain SB) TaxID=56780 RepID=Q2LSC2_SYNAS|nr:hypothetical cytosolic protein [Syntrophus aciditrophicus SB]
MPAKIRNTCCFIPEGNQENKKACPNDRPSVTVCLNKCALYRRGMRWLGSIAANVEKPFSP